MASLSYVVYVLASLLNPVSFFLYGHHTQYIGTSNSSIEHDHAQYKAALFVFGDSQYDAGDNRYLLNVRTTQYSGHMDKHSSIIPQEDSTTDAYIVPDFIGGRKFAFQNAGQLGCIPHRKQLHNSTDGCVEGLNNMANLHNTALVFVLKEFDSQLSGFKYSVFDCCNAIYDRIRDPAKHGFTYATDGCCGIGVYRGDDCGGLNGTKPYEVCNNVEDYLWFDASHTTEYANIQLAELIWSGTPNVTIPYNVKQLFQQVPAD